MTPLSWPVITALLAPVRRRDVVEEIEGEAVFRVLFSVRHGQPPAHQRADHIAFGELDATPSFDVFRDREIGNRAIVTARLAEPVGRLRFDQPIAGAGCGIVAIAVFAAAGAERAEGFGAAFESAHCKGGGKKSDLSATGEADVIVEMERRAAALAFEELHISGSPTPSTRAQRGRRRETGGDRNCSIWPAGRRRHRPGGF